MIILPAIDMYEGKAVRLFKGDYSAMTVYSEDPVAVAGNFADCGAEWVHLVDLEGARDGTTPNFETACSILRSSGLKAEIGGGIRSEDTIRRYLDAGFSRVILGTAAVSDEGFLTQMAQKHGERLAVSVDCRNGMVATKGWTELSAVSCMDFCGKLQEIGVRTIICTDISRDGAMRGTNTKLYGNIKDAFSLNVIASGGVSSMEDITALKKLDIYGAIIGKAYYTGAVDLSRALEEAAV